MLKIEGRNLPYVQWGDSTRARVGDWVLAIGNPYGLGGTVTAGIISALHRGITGVGAYDRYIQTDAAINMGNSGGPMFDLNGNVIGINSALISPTGASVGIGLAIPAELAKPVIDSLMRGQRPQRGYLGVSLQPVDDNSIAAALGLPKGGGELVRSIVPGGAAARAGIQQGDVIVRVNGQQVTPDQTVSFLVANTTVGSRVPIELVRGGKRMTVTAIVAQRPTEEALAKITGGAGTTGGAGADFAGRAAKSARTVAGPAHAGAGPGRQSAGQRRAAWSSPASIPTAMPRKRVCSAATRDLGQWRSGLGPGAGHRRGRQCAQGRPAERAAAGQARGRARGLRRHRHQRQIAGRSTRLSCCRRGGVLVGRRAREPALLLLHRDLLGDAGRVLGIGLRHRAVIDGLAAHRTHALSRCGRHAASQPFWRRSPERSSRRHQVRSGSRRFWLPPPRWPSPGRSPSPAPRLRVNNPWSAGWL